jgi:hypothetical protein
LEIAIAEFSGLKQIQKSRETFPWRKNIRSLATIGSATFSEAQFEEENPFILKIPKRLSVYGDDLRLFEYSLRFTTDNPFNSYLDVFGSSWPLIFLKCPPPTWTKCSRHLSRLRSSIHPMKSPHARFCLHCAVICSSLGLLIGCA